MEDFFSEGRTWALFKASCLLVISLKLQYSSVQWTMFMEENLTHAARECGVVRINNPSMLWNWRLSHFCRGRIKKWLSQSRTRKERSRRERVVWNEVLLWKENWDKKIGFFKDSPDLRVTVQKVISTTRKNWAQKEITDQLIYFGNECIFTYRSQSLFVCFFKNYLSERREQILPKD